MSHYQIDNYNLVTKNRYASNHGGLAFYIHNDWNYEIKPSIAHQPYWEEMFIKIIDPRNVRNNFIVGNFYRPPHDHIDKLTNFIEYFGNSLSNLETQGEHAYVCGDHNIDLLKIKSNVHNYNFFEHILTSGFLPAITLPTRLSDNSTLIDNMFYNSSNKFVFGAILRATSATTV